MDPYELMIKNMMLFKSLHSNEPTEEKYQKICKYLAETGDVNAADQLDNDNTLLHVAVMHNDLKLTRMLLENNANVTIKNRSGQNSLDLAKSLTNKINTDEIVSLLEDHTPEVGRKISKQNIKKLENLKHKKREATSGVRGQLYETKLTSLILLRALTDHEIKKFYLGTNVDGVGDLDDVCLKYELRNDPIKKLLFIQAKHKEDPEQGKINLDGLKNNLSVFSLSKYFKSYIGIKNMFKMDNKDPIFRGDFHKHDCVLVLFTTAKNNIPNQYKTVNTTSHQIKSILRIKGRDIKDDDVFQINDPTLVLKPIVAKRIQSIGELLKSSILNDNDKKYSNLMSNELIKRYHVVLAQRVINVSDIRKKDLGKSQIEKYRDGTFSEDFLSTEDELLRILRETIFQDITLEDRHKYKPELFSFKLPETFGNIDLQVRKPQRIESLARNFVKLFEGSKSNKITIDENLFQNTNEVGVKIEKGFVNLNGGIAGLVGNLLIIDNDTNLLKFNVMENLSDGNAKNLLQYILNELKVQENVLYQYRFEINLEDFPTLFLDKDEQDTLLAKEFLSKLWFFTNQPSECQIEKGLKIVIERMCRLEKKQILKIQSDAIYLRFHDAVQKWWLIPKESQYLTIDCNYLEKSKNITIGSPYLAVLDFISTNKIKKHEIKLKENAVNVLCAQDLLNEQYNVWNINTSEVFFTVIKLAQYFECNSSTDVTFLDVEYIIDEGFCDMVEAEILETTKSMLKLIKFLIFIHKNPANTTKLCDMIENIRKDSKIKIIIVSKPNISSEIASQCNENCITKVDENVNLDDILNVKAMCKNWTVYFQGHELKFNDVIDENSEGFVHSEVLWNLISNEIVEIGRPLENSMYNEVKKYCIPRSLIRGEERSKCTFKDIDENVVIVAAEPGMGKSILLSQLALNWKELKHNNLRTSKWVVIINLLDYSREFKRWQIEKIKICTNEAIKFMYKAAIKGLNINERKGKKHKSTQTDLNAFKISVDGEKIQLKPFIKDQIILFQLQLFLYYYGTGNVLFLFDGFDEICPHYEKEVLSLLKILTTKNHGPDCNLLIPISITQSAMNMLSNTSPTCNCQRASSQQQTLWVTTRSYRNVKNTLEKELGRAAYSLKPLSREEQTRYLQQFMEINFNLTDLTDTEIKNLSGFFKYMMNILSGENKHIKMVNVPLYTIYAAALEYFQNLKNYMSLDDILKENLQEKFYTKSCERQYDVNQLTTVFENPLYLYIAAEYFIDQIKNDETIPLNEDEINCKWDVSEKSFSLFEHFLDIKFRKIRFEEKKKIDLDNPDNEMSFEKERKDFIEMHKRLALCALYEDSDLLKANIISEADLKVTHGTIQRIDAGEEKTGVVEKVVNNIPRFVHLVFAEFFAIEYICDKLQTAFSTEHNEPLIVEHREALWNFVINMVLYESAGGVRTFFDHKLKEDSDFLDVISRTQSKKIAFEELLQQAKKHTITPEGFNSNFQIIRTSFNVAIEENLFNIQKYLLTCLEECVNEENLDGIVKFIANSFLLITAFGMNNDDLMYKLRDCVSHLNRSPSGMLVAMIAPTFMKDIVPFALTPSNLISRLPMITSSFRTMQLANISITDALTPSLRSLILEHIKLLWDLSTSN